MRKLSLVLSSFVSAFVVVGCANVADVSNTKPQSRGTQALDHANDCANNGADACDDVATALQDGGDADAAVDDAHGAIDEARASLADAASEGACTCDTAGLQSAIQAGDTDLQPILDGCNTADADALALAADAQPGLCEAIAHQIGEVEDTLADLEQQLADVGDDADVPGDDDGDDDGVPGLPGDDDGVPADDDDDDGVPGDDDLPGDDDGVPGDDDNGGIPGDDGADGDSVSIDTENGVTTVTCNDVQVTVTPACRAAVDAADAAIDQLNSDFVAQCVADPVNGCDADALDAGIDAAFANVSAVCCP